MNLKISEGMMSGLVTNVLQENDRNYRTMIVHIHCHRANQWKSWNAKLRVYGQYVILGSLGCRVQGYQPIVDHAHGEVCGFEALNRPFEENSAIASEVWFRSTCEQGRHIERDLLVLQDALTTRKMFPHSNLSIFVSVSPQNILNPRFYA